jgi:L-aspartate semialdehyde sulfurtransferase ferredoxin
MLFIELTAVGFINKISGSKYLREDAVFSKILILRFPKTEVQKPIVCFLVKDYNLTFNILNAAILPRKEGVMVLELFGVKKDFKAGMEYLKRQGVQVQNAASEVKRNTKQCTHCGACTAVCPTGALSIQRPEMEVVFQQEKCSVCQLCLPACPPRAMTVRPTHGAFFE